MPSRAKVPIELRQEIIFKLNRGVPVQTIVSLLQERGQTISRQTIWRLARHFQTHGEISPLPKSGRPTKLTREILDMIETSMQDDDETTAKEIKKALENLGKSISLTTILKGRKMLGWTFRGTAYCQMIRDVNKEKRLAWALANKDATFEDVIWTDETSVQLESHRRFCCRKRGQEAKIQAPTETSH